MESLDNLLNNDIIRLVSKSKKFVPHFHIPLQLGSNDILLICIVETFEIFIPKR